MSCLYDQAKEPNHLWGAVVVAALVVLVILWRKDKLHMSCLKWRSRSAVRYVHIELLSLFNYDSYFYGRLNIVLHVLEIISSLSLSVLSSVHYSCSIWSVMCMLVACSVALLCPQHVLS